MQNSCEVSISLLGCKTLSLNCIDFSASQYVSLSSAHSASESLELLTGHLFKFPINDHFHIQPNNYHSLSVMPQN